MHHHARLVLEHKLGRAEAAGHERELAAAKHDQAVVCLFNAALDLRCLHNVVKSVCIRAFATRPPAVQHECLRILFAQQP